ncbi:S9 family peptidase [Wenzhouxiangella limi]|uniref:S9 family peptidase n=1 Tax=Wenzhouxiangella limi TaxID=2707351 RepID=A0A845UVM5_9GAMM|nr:S9 family peptidase [Wenzhouxiangella limi]NDY94638.1 S9 family peptidase [Wenzhouxiangella limi]
MRLKSMLFCLVSLGLMASLSALADDGMTLEQIARLEQVGQVAISPDGQNIAYTRSVPRRPGVDEDGPAWAELHLIDASGVSRGFITGEVNIGQLGWMPDGSAVTFVATRGDDEHAALYRIPVGGGEAQRLISVGTGVAGYSLSPDGERVALVATDPLDEEIQSLHDKGFDQVIFEEDWRPRRLWIAELENGEPEPVEIDGSVQRVQWSPAGDRLAVVVTPRQLVDDTLMFPRIRIIRPDGEELGRIENPGKLGQSAWSPDGDHFAFIATDIINDTREGRLMVADRDGGEWLNLLPDLEGHVWHVDWNGPDRVLFISYEGVEARVGQIAVDGSAEQTLFAEDGLIFDALSVAESGRLALRAHTPAHPPEVYAAASASGAPERLTDSNPWLEDVALARQEVVRYPAADGLEIEGLLVRPLDYREGQRYPLILAAHGGPEAHYSNGWLTSYNLPAQHAAAEGYFMFYPNYRGSTGRGVEFALTSQGRPAKEEFSDLVDGIDHLVEQGLVDGERVGITGGSYGGYASAWAATYYSERFAAAVMNVGLSDKIAMLGTSDIPQELYLLHYRTWPWEDWDLYRKASPIYYAEQAQTPILILHGDADPRVDPTQSRILYRYLVLQDDPPPVRLVLYRGEGHGNRRAAPRWDYSLRLMRWMDHYLKGEGGDPPPYQIDYRLD